ncbi:tRNA (guanosine(18)-2'-O)-methyltransferase TrmH [Oceanicoccus sp. KOV_DT_Chl]|uniref:tRNA (guanosine(18)-2'-O)-methyltransferase TrmH n=1 Tax=Oceanicoccus sp. KOV_DT_Chl TaxID=1904639 RepID=UPI000C7E19B3|nr:tRNA (guanosine(18)-2'-O)-methyltransferase TrmH [Oceanicoccus sp. KOV_DT_Chl]
MTPERYHKIHSILARRQPDLTVVTDYVHKGRNLSAIVRTADAVGVGDVHCVIGDKDYTAFRGTALGSHRYVKVHRHRQLSAPVDDLKRQGFQVVAAHLSAEAVDYHQVDFCQPTALLLGAEKEGLSELGSELADIHITIPMVGMVESFNVSVAAGIILNEARHQRQQQGLYGQQRIDQASYDQLFFEWAHPKIRDFCRSNGLAYPPLREDGEIDNPSQWYADMRDIIATRKTA